MVNASSEKGHLAIDGMSYADRSAAASNSAIVVQVSPEDYPGDVLEGLAFQRELERKSFELCAGKIPTQRYGDFKKRQKSTEVSEENPPMVKGAWEFGDLNQVFPKVLSAAIIEGMEQFRDLIERMPFYILWKAAPLLRYGFFEMKNLKAIFKACILWEKEPDIPAESYLLPWMGSRLQER